MASRRERWPPWAEAALQGLAYWIGHRWSLFHSHRLPEGALVAEACNLIHANLDSSQSLSCEVMYRKLLPHNYPRTVLGDRDRADLVVADKQGTEKRTTPTRENVRFIMEVKRFPAPRAKIEDDLKRLHAALTALNGSARCFLFLISEGRRPPEFIDAKGNSILKQLPIGGCGYYQLRTARKAAPKFNKPDIAHFACLVELYADKRG